MFNELLNAIMDYKQAATKEYGVHSETVSNITNTYAPAVAEQLLTEETKNFTKALETPRITAKQAISRGIGKARNYINYQLANVDSKAINEIRSLQGLSLGETEISALQKKYNGSYWTRKTLNTLLNELLPPTAQIPDVSPDATLALLDKMENELNFAIDYYDGCKELDSSIESIACERVMSGVSFSDYAAALNSNPAFTEECIENFYAPLTDEQEKQMYKTFFRGLDTDYDRKKKVAEMVQYGLGEQVERSKFAKYLPEDYEPCTGVGSDPVE